MAHNLTCTPSPVLKHQPRRFSVPREGGGLEGHQELLSLVRCQVWAGFLSFMEYRCWSRFLESLASLTRTRTWEGRCWPWFSCCVMMEGPPCGGWESLSEWLVNVALGKAAHSRAVCLSEGKEGALSQHSSLATPVETDFLLCFTNLLLGGCWWLAALKWGCFTAYLSLSRIHGVWWHSVLCHKGSHWEYWTSHAEDKRGNMLLLTWVWINCSETVCLVHEAGSD